MQQRACVRHCWRLADGHRQTSKWWVVRVPHQSNSSSAQQDPSTYRLAVVQQGCHAVVVRHDGSGLQ